MVTVAPALPHLEATTVELASDPVAQGVNTSAEDADWGAGTVILVVVLCIVAVAAGILGFRSTARKKERLEHRDPVSDRGAEHRS